MTDTATSTETKLTKEERDHLEILSLRAQNLNLTRTMLQQQFDKTTEALAKNQAELRQLTDIFRDKYGLDVSRDKINEDGTFVKG